MASSMSSTFTTGEKRKKVITYGKLSRLPPPRTSILDEDAPSPERPHKQSALSRGPSAGSGGLVKSARPSAHARAATASPDVFDVPSDDEFGVPSTTPAKRPEAQRSKTEGAPPANIAKKAANVTEHTSAAAPQPQKSAIAKSVEVKAKASQEQIRPQGPTQGKETSARIRPANMKSTAKASQITASQKEVSGNGQPLQRLSTSSKDTSRATTPGTGPQAISKPLAARKISSTILRKPAKPAVRQPASLDLFDVPSDEEAASLPIPAAPRQTPRPLSKVVAKQPEAGKVSSLETKRKPSELGNLQNRKRKGSVSLATAPASAIEPTQQAAKVQRESKVLKRQAGTSARPEPAKVPIFRPAHQPVIPESAINKPKRTRIRTVPVVSQPAMAKGQSSPAVLHRMLPLEQATKSTYEDASEVPASDDTMYDIPDPVTTPVRRTPLRRTISSTPGSVTPRQKDLFSTLLGGTSAPKTPASALAALQLTDKKPRSLLGALARSKSDVSHTSQSRKTRLIATLKDDETSSEDEGSSSDDEADSTIVASSGVDIDKTPVRIERMVVEEVSNEDLMNEKQGDSQTSQMSAGATIRPKLTYATQRSYLQEANPEDEFLISMDMDDGWKMDSQTVSTDDEDGSQSQPRTHHELKKYGQNTMFSWDMEESIREISDKSNRSGRRSAMMDLCTKMADAGFVSQLLDSGFMHKLLENIAAPTDTIFDFIATVSVLFILQTKPTFAAVDQINRTGIMSTLISLIDKEVDISRLARDRKSNMSKIAQESLAEFRALVLTAKTWSSSTPETLSPQIVALQTIEVLVQNLRESGSTEALLTPTDVSQLVAVTLSSSRRIKTTASAQDCIVLDLTISILEIVSIVEQGSSTWPTKVLQQLSEVISVFFEGEGLTKAVEAMKLCMNLTNNKGKACQPFSTRAFVQPLLQSLVESFKLLNTGSLDKKGQDALTLNMGAMINLAELNDQARLNAVGDTSLIEALVKTYVVGSERAAQATSFEESEVGIKINFLGVLLGMLCLNTAVRSKIRALLPGEQLHLLLDNMRVFARIHETVDEKTAKRLEGPEGQEALNNYYVRIMHVVKKLESARA
ncbi:hypothetical protein SLS61_005830 [Didymella pomorum]